MGNKYRFSALIQLLLTAVLVSTLTPSGVWAQAPGEVLHTQKLFSPAPARKELFGASITSLGDVNGDGITDLAVGAGKLGLDNVQHPTHHRWLLFMGPDGQPLSDPPARRSPATTPDCEKYTGGCPTSWVVAGLGDLDGDGTPDMATGTPVFGFKSSYYGAVGIRFLEESGSAKGGTYHEYELTSRNGYYGRTMVNLGDFDEDPETRTALAISTFHEYGGVRVIFLDSTGTIQATGGWASPNYTDYNYGQALANLGDLDGDGIPEVAVGHSEGVEIVFLRSDGRVKNRTNNGFAGGGLAGLGDLDGDGIPDLAASDGVNTTLLFLTADGTAKDSLLLSGYGGTSMTGMGAFFGAGTVTLAIGNPRDDEGCPVGRPGKEDCDRGAVWLLSLATGNAADTTPPVCEIVDVVDGSRIDVRVQDAQSGLASITAIKHKNASVTYDTFPPGTQEPVLVTATRIQPDRRVVVVLEVADVAGNLTTCDPVLTTIEGEQPLAFRLDQNYPNPFNPTTVIPFAVPEAAAVRVVVYDVLGRVVATLVDERVEAGRYAAAWDGRDGQGRAVPSGVYVVRMEAGTFVQTRRMTLVK